MKCKESHTNQNGADIIARESALTFPESSLSGPLKHLPHLEPGMKRIFMDDYKKKEI